MKKLIIFLFCSIIIFSACNNKEETTSRFTTITGNIANYNQSDATKYVTFFIYNYLGSEWYNEVKVPIDTSGNFKINIDIPHKQKALFSFNNNMSSLFLAPNEQINIKFDANKKNEEFDKSIVFKGNLSKINEQYQKYSTNLKLDLNTYYSSFSTEKSPEKIYHLTDSIANLKNKYTQAFFKNNTIDKDLVHFINTDLKISKIKDLLQYAVFHHRVKKDEDYGKSLGENYINAINNFDTFSKKDFINESLYNTFPNYYIPFLRTLKKTPYNQVDSTFYGTNFLIKEDNPLFTKVMFYDRLKNALKNNDTLFYHKYKKVIDSIFENSEYHEVIKTNYAIVRNRLINPQLPDKAELLTFKANTAEGILEEIIKNANGKVIYIDNWATWCGPCKSQFKSATPKLKKEFSDNVEFVYLCHRSNKSQYKPTIAQFKVEGKHYFINDELNKNLAKLLNITGYPTYNIINKKGELVHSGFEFRPSIPKTAEILTQLIKEENEN